MVGVVGADLGTVLRKFGDETEAAYIGVAKPVGGALKLDGCDPPSLRALGGESCNAVVLIDGIENCERTSAIGVCVRGAWRAD